MRYMRRKNNEQIEHNTKHNTEHIYKHGNEHIEHNTEHKTTGISDAPIYYKLKYEELSTEYKSLKVAHKSTIDELREEIKSLLSEIKLDSGYYKLGIFIKNASLL